MKAAPYPVDTRAKGWRFELDLERIQRSDTWTLTPAELRPWLLMLWSTAWQQEPCGSLPDDDELIASRIGMKLGVFTKYRGKLMRGWWKAEDGRLYHSTIVLRVQEMLTARERERNRKAEWRKNRKTADVSGEVSDPSAYALDASLGTVEGHQRDSTGRDDTGTGTGTGTGTSVDNTVGTAHAIDNPAYARAAPASLSAAMRRHSIAASPSDPRVIMAVEAGITVATVEAACLEAKAKKPNQRIPPAYVLAIAESLSRATAQPRASPYRVTPNMKPHWRETHDATVAALTGRSRTHDQPDNQTIDV